MSFDFAQYFAKKPSQYFANKPSQYEKTVLLLQVL